jgi:hypothetical protein
VVTQLLRGPTAGDAGADDDGVVGSIECCHAYKLSAA